MCSISFAFLRWMRCRLPFAVCVPWTYSIHNTYVPVHLLQCSNCFNWLVGMFSVRMFQSHLSVLFSLFCQLFFEFGILWIIQNSNAKYCSEKNGWTIICCRVLNTKIWRLLVMGTLLISSIESQVCSMHWNNKNKRISIYLTKCENC